MLILGVHVLKVSEECSRHKDSPPSYLTNSAFPQVGQNNSEESYSY